MKSFIVKIPVSQEGLGVLLAKIADEGGHYDIEAVDDGLPYWKNGKKRQKAEKPVKKAKPEAKKAHGAVTNAIIGMLPTMPQMFKAIELKDSLMEQTGVDARNIYGVIGNLVRRGILEKMAEGRYKKVSQ